MDSDDCAVSETEARKHADQSENTVFISPYNDLDVICGQGTIALEIMKQLNNEVDCIFVPVGGGGMISGIAAYVNCFYPHCKVIGCQPKSNACMWESIQQGRILGDEDFANNPTLSDGTAGGIEVSNGLRSNLVGCIANRICLAAGLDYVYTVQRAS